MLILKFSYYKGGTKTNVSHHCTGVLYQAALNFKMKFGSVPIEGDQNERISLKTLCIVAV